MPEATGGGKGPSSLLLLTPVSKDLTGFCGTKDRGRATSSRRREVARDSFLRVILLLSASVFTYIDWEKGGRGEYGASYLRSLALAPVKYVGDLSDLVKSQYGILLMAVPPSLRLARAGRSMRLEKDRSPACFVSFHLREAIRNSSSTGAVTIRARIPSQLQLPFE